MVTSRRRQWWGTKGRREGSDGEMMIVSRWWEADVATGRRERFATTGCGGRLRMAETTAVEGSTGGCRRQGRRRQRWRAVTAEGSAREREERR
ncbi:unnamed protein product [Linum trigynum]|uniref:Uncharacterized protein n=1 Tax=Linum trigynum TaxID=586398 RepID=A0AAV2EH63_9ROSI